MQQFILDRETRDLSKIVGFLSALSPKKMWKVTVSLYRRDRSDLQNHALWGVAYKMLSDETGNDAEDLHDYFLRKYFGEVEVWVLDECIKRPRRTTTMNSEGKRDLISTVEFKEFYALIQRVAAIELGIEIPDPDPALRAA